jgi:hypothetical protein
MPEESRLPTNEEVKRALQEAVLKNYPNPERKGCAGSEVLKQIARQDKPFEDPHWDHIQHCSPCYQEFLEFRRDFKRRQIVTRRAAWAAGLAAVLILAIVPFAWSRFSAKQSGQPVAVLNFEYAITERGASGAKESVQHLPRARGEYDIYLKIGSEPGPYDVEIRDSSGAAVAHFSGSAVMQGGTTLLRINADLTKIPAGSYDFAYRRAGGEWRELPVELA